MNSDRIRQTIISSWNGTTTFPQVVSGLLEEGIESYHVDLVRRENRYYLPAGDSHVESVPFAHNRPAERFSIDAIKAAIKSTQAGKIGYRHFIDEITAAGCVYYIAYLKGKRVSYFGRDGDCHVEYFPSAK